MNSACPICDLEKFKIIGKPGTNKISKDFIDKDYSIVQCTNCSVYYVAPSISFSSKQWAMLYNSEYFSLQSSWLIKKRKKELSERFDKASKLLSKTDISFLDIGCGEGKALLEGTKRGWDVTGIDIVDNRMKDAKIGSIKFITENFIDFKLQENSFDFIYLDSVLEHVLTPIPYLLKIKKLLRAGGIVYIGVPNEDSLYNNLRSIVFKFAGRRNISAKIKPFDSPYHVIGFNKKALTYIFNNISMDVISIRNFGRKMDFLGCKPTQRGFWISLLFLFPVEFIGKILSKDVYFELYIKK